MSDSTQQPTLHDSELAALRRSLMTREGLRPVLLIGGPALLVLVAAYVYVMGGRYVSTDDAYVKQNKVPISSDASGRVVQLAARENQKVKVGQLLFLLDEQPYRISLERAEAQLDTVRMDLETMRNLEISRQRDSFRRDSSQPPASFDSDPNVPIERHPRYLQARAQRDQAALELSYTRVVSPVAGQVSNLDLEVGVYVRAGTPVFIVVQTDPVWVEANFKETDLEHMHAGQPATISADAYPGVSILAKVSGIGAGTGAEFSLLPPQNATGNWVKVVQRVPVRLLPVVRDPQAPLRAGMSVTAEVDTGHRRGVFGLFSGAPLPTDQDQP